MQRFLVKNGEKYVKKNILEKSENVKNMAK